MAATKRGQACVVDDDEMRRYYSYVSIAQGKNLFGSLFSEDDFGRPSCSFASFAVMAWKQATGPVMSPPLVVENKLVQDIVLKTSEHDQESLIAQVSLVCPLPAQLNREPVPVYGGWKETAIWGIRGPEASDVLTQTFMLPTVTVVTNLSHPGHGLPDTQLGRFHELNALGDDAFSTVICVVGALNDALKPVITALEQWRQ